MRPGDLGGLTAEDEVGFYWLENAYNAGSNHKLVVKDRYGELCRNKEVVCKGTTNWSGSVYERSRLLAHAIQHNINMKMVEKQMIVNGGNVMQRYVGVGASKGNLGCTIGVADKTKLLFFYNNILYFSLKCSINNNMNNNTRFRFFYFDL